MSYQPCIKLKPQGREQSRNQKETLGPGPSLTPAQELLVHLWEKHLRHEFVTHDAEATVETMVEDAYVNHVPVLTGGVGQEELREFYAKYFIPQMPADTDITLISRTIGNDRLVDEMVVKFTHSLRMDWMLPGLEPTGKRIEVPVVTNTSTGTRPRCWSSLACWTLPACPSQGLRAPEKFSIRA